MRAPQPNPRESEAAEGELPVAEKLSVLATMRRDSGKIVDTLTDSVIETFSPHFDKALEKIVLNSMNVLVKPEFNQIYIQFSLQNGTPEDLQETYKEEYLAIPEATRPNILDFVLEKLLLELGLNNDEEALEALESKTVSTNIKYCYLNMDSLIREPAATLETATVDTDSTHSQIDAALGEDESAVKKTPEFRRSEIHGQIDKLSAKKREIEAKIRDLNEELGKTS
ncbi:MAG: hypothetical protein AAB373_03715 [Patescibacteria group bacterium]